MVSTLLNFVPYFLALFVIALGVLSLLSDWQDHKDSRLRKAVVAVYFCVGILTIASIYLDSEEKRTAGERITELKGQVESANTAQKENTKLFVGSFDKLSSELSRFADQSGNRAVTERDNYLAG